MPQNKKNLAVFAKTAVKYSLPKPFAENANTVDFCVFRLQKAHAVHEQLTGQKPARPNLAVEPVPAALRPAHGRA
jgi:hypothetical protein